MKILILGIGLMFTSLTAFALPDNVQVVSDQTIHKIEKQLFADLSFAPIEQSWPAEATGVLVIQTEVSKSETFSDFTASVTLIDLNLFYWPIVYERKSPADLFKIHNSPEKLKRELPIEKRFRKRQSILT